MKLGLNFIHRTVLLKSTKADFIRDKQQQYNYIQPQVTHSRKENIVNHAKIMSIQKLKMKHLLYLQVVLNYETQITDLTTPIRLTFV